MRADNMTHTTPVTPGRRWQPGAHVYSQSGNVAHVVDVNVYGRQGDWTRCGRPIHTPPWQGNDHFSQALADSGRICRICQPPEAAHE